MRKVTLGGDRLGSGKKMKVELKGYERSTHDLSYAFRSTMSAGTLVPFLNKVALPGDTWDIDLQCDVKTLPTTGPLFGSEKVQLDVFIAPMRLYNRQMANNTLGIGRDMSVVKFPEMSLYIDPDAVLDFNNIDNAQINPSSVLKYLGYSGVGHGVGLTTGALTERTFQCMPFLMYHDVVKNYYTNKQEEKGYVIHREIGALVETITLIEVEGTMLTQGITSIIDIVTYAAMEITYAGAVPNLDQVIITTNRGNMPLSDVFILQADLGTVLQGTWDYGKTGNITLFQWDYIAPGDIADAAPLLYEYPLENIDRMREFLLEAPNATPANINELDLEPYNYILNWPQGTTASGQISPYSHTQEGLAVKTYQSDLFNNWLNEEWIEGVEGVNAISSVAIDPATQSFSMDVLNVAEKVYEYLNRIVVSDGTYKSWLEVSYDEEAYLGIQTPVYEGGLIKELVFQEVVSNAEAGDASESQPLGTLAGRGVMSGKHKGGRVRISVKEPSYIMGIVSITPRIDYSQGNEWDTGLRTMADLHVPALDEIGFQDLVQEQMAWWTTDVIEGGGSTTVVQKSAGKQPAWINYMTSVNKTFGDFAIATNSMFMTLNRRYEGGTEGGLGIITDLTTYIDPVKANYCFAQSNLNAMNYWVQIGVGIEARRKMSAKIMPSM